MLQPALPCGRRSRRPFAAAGLLLLVAGLWLWWWSAVHADLHALRRLVRRRFPRVRQISTETLDAWLRSNAAPPLLLDLRDEKEYTVSHLPGAIRANLRAGMQEILLAARKDAPIVTYCAIGWRSSGFAQRLMAAGFTNVRNLDGAIFQWANEDRLLVRGAHPVAHVHPFSRFWSRLVKAARRAPLHR